MSNRIEDQFDRSLWNGCTPFHKLGWKDADEALMEVYARDTDVRVEALQARSRGCLLRRMIKPKQYVPSVTVESSLQLLGPQTHRVSKHGHIGPNSSQGDVTESTDIQATEPNFLNDPEFAARKPYEMPNGWALSWLPCGTVRFCERATGLHTDRHPLQGDAELVYGQDFNVTRAWQSYRALSSSSGSSAQDADALLDPTIGELALKSCAFWNSSVEKFSWRIEDAFRSSCSQDDETSLCCVCRHIDFRNLLTMTQFAHNLRLSLRPLHTILAETVCPFCKLAACNASLEMSPAILERCTSKQSLPMRCEVFSLEMMALGISFLDSTGKLLFTGRILQLSPTAEKTALTAAINSYDVGASAAVEDQVNIESMKLWLSNCEAGHCGPLTVTGKGHALRAERERQCVPHRLESSHHLPLTVIDVWRACLVEIDDCVRYVALSYTWGRYQDFRNDRSRNQELHVPQSLPRNTLPMTISDAMEFVKLMGESYLWVDSLCIVQDDEEAKMAQISNMGNIYSRAYFIVVAAHGRDCDAGLPGVRRGARRVRDGRVTIHGVTLVSELPNYREMVEFSTWNSRGWTYQESELCPRHIAFTEFQAYFRCNREIWTEQNGPMTRQNSREYAYNVHLTFQTNFLSYSDAVRHYTKRVLGQSDDVLNAFQGLLALLRPLFKSDFIHGLPETELDMALLWQPSAPNFHRRVDLVTGEADFPSWSWAGWVGPCSYFDWTDHVLDDLSMVHWQDGTTGLFFTSDELRAPAGRPTFKPDVPPNRDAGWTARRSRERVLYDMLAWMEDRNPALWYLHPTANENERTPRTLVLPGSQKLRFRALTAFFTLAFNRTKRRDEREWIEPAIILDRDGFEAGVIPVHKHLLGALGAHAPAKQVELVCLSRRRGNEWVDFASRHADDSDYVFPQLSADLVDRSAKPTLYPRQESEGKEWENQDYFDIHRYNVHRPFPLYNVMWIARKDGEPHVAERVAIGTIHVTAYAQALPQWETITLV